MRFDQTRQNLAGSQLDHPINASRLHRQYAFAPAHHAGDLLDQQTCGFLSK